MTNHKLATAWPTSVLLWIVALGISLAAYLAKATYEQGMVNTSRISVLEYERVGHRETHEELSHRLDRIEARIDRCEERTSTENLAEVIP